jgi:hypothetical protein
MFRLSAQILNEYSNNIVSLDASIPKSGVLRFSPIWCADKLVELRDLQYLTWLRGGDNLDEI